MLSILNETKTKVFQQEQWKKNCRKCVLLMLESKAKKMKRKMYIIKTKEEDETS